LAANRANAKTDMAMKGRIIRQKGKTVYLIVSS